MRVTTRDPMTGNEVRDPDHAPFVLEGEGDGALKIYFESDLTRQDYLAIKPRVPQPCSLNLYRTFENDETILWD